MVGDSLLDFVEEFRMMIGISRYDAVMVILMLIICHGVDESIELRMDCWFSAGQGNPSPDFPLFAAFLQHIRPCEK